MNCTQKSKEGQTSGYVQLHSADRALIWGLVGYSLFKWVYILIPTWPLFVKEDRVWRDRNNKEQNPGEALRGRSAPRSQREAMERRRMRKSCWWGGRCIVTKRKVSKTSCKFSSNGGNLLHKSFWTNKLTSWKINEVASIVSQQAAFALWEQTAYCCSKEEKVCVETATLHMEPHL